MSCVGCKNYVVDPENKIITMFYCKSQNKREKFPGKGCSGFMPREFRYEKYDHEKYCKERGIDVA